jgi:hypothetical protein
LPDGFRLIAGGLVWRMKVEGHGAKIRVEKGLEGLKVVEKG